MINLVTRNRPICNRPSEMGNLIAGSAIFMTPAWFSHFSVLFSLRFGFPPAREATEADFTHRLCLRRRRRCLRRCNCNYWSLLQVFRPSIHNIYICVDTRIYLYIYKFGVVGIFSVVVVAVFDFFRSRPAWEMFATRLQSNGKSGFSFELKKKNKNKNNDVRNPKICLPPIVWQIIGSSVRFAGFAFFPQLSSALRQVFTAAKLLKMSASTPPSSYLPRPLTNVQKDLPICVQLSSLKIVKVNKLIETKSNYMETELISVRRTNFWLISLQLMKW